MALKKFLFDPSRSVKTSRASFLCFFQEHDSDAKKVDDRIEN